MVYRAKLSGPYCEFIVRERGPADHPTLRIEVDSTYDDRFVGFLKGALRHNTERHWDGEAKRWYIAPVALDRAVEIAIACYSNVFKTDGEEVLDLITGAEIPQTLSLFK